MQADGGAARQLTTNQAADRLPTWSPDGKEIVFDSFRRGIADIWILTLETGEERVLVERQAADTVPVWSPDGQWVVFRSNQSGQFEAWRVAAGGGEPEQLTTAGASQPQWSRDGREIYFWRDGQFWALTLSDRFERPLTAFTGKTGHGNIGSFSVGDDHLYFVWIDDQGDIWVIDVVTDEDE